MVSLIEQYLKDNWRIIAQESVVPDRLNIVKLGGQISPRGSLNLLLFVEKERKPKYFLKVNRRANEFSAIEKEFNNLKYIKNYLPLGMALTFPHPMFMGKVDKTTTIMVETFLGGRQINLNSYVELEKLFSKSFEWLKSFFSATKKSAVSFRSSELKKRLALIVEKFEFDREFNKKLKTIFKKADEFDGVSFPLCSSQGDFGFVNILIGNKDIAIVDWEDYKDNSHAFLDVEFFIFISALYFYKKDGHIKSFDKFFSKKAKTYKLADFYINDYCQFLGVEKTLFYLVSIMDTIGIIQNGYGKHRCIPMQNIDFLNALVDLALRETD